ncbi:MAG: hypothetical protein WA082_00700 [Candidatus Moraniibacteriota bacterium]
MFGKPTKSLVVSVLIIMGTFFVLTHASAALKDSDADGVTDQAESETYFTDPLNADSDSDSVPDGDEIIHRSDPLNKEENPLQAIEQSFPQERLPAWLLAWLASVGTLIGASIIGWVISALVRKRGA